MLTSQEVILVSLSNSTAKAVELMLMSLLDEMQCWSICRRETPQPLSWCWSHWFTGKQKLLSWCWLTPWLRQTLCSRSQSVSTTPESSSKWMTHSWSKSSIMACCILIFRTQMTLLPSLLHRKSLPGELDWLMMLHASAKFYGHHKHKTTEYDHNPIE